MIIGNKTFDTKQKCYIMGILNVTPDSFSDGGKWDSLDKALAHTEEMIRQGADIIDVGGESTRPGHVQITDQEEIDRVTPVIEAVRGRFDVPISVDTYKSKVAKAAIAAGADLVNDIWGLKYDPDMAKTIADAKVACCLMHNREKAAYADFMKDFLTDLGESVKIAEDAGIAEDKIILDPGVGFGKTYEMNLEVIREISQMHQYGYPILLGTSNKSVIGNALDLPTGERLEGTLATTVIGVMNHCSFIRVHQIQENKRAIQMTEAIMGR